ncbi:MAG: hypothetical protein V7604_548 [Hyphomicrobiales bacterium]|jgi:hypothetical protein
MMEFLAGLSLFLFIVLGLGLVGLSTRYRFTSRTAYKSAAMDEETSDRWRFGFFVGWTLFLPLVWLLEWYGWYGFHKDWQNMPQPLPEFTYGRKVISDLWTAVAAVLGLLAWNKKP